MITPNMKVAALTSYYISYKLLFVTASLGHVERPIIMLMVYALGLD